jgi:hypothetical protein
VIIDDNGVLFGIWPQTSCAMHDLTIQTLSKARTSFLTLKLKKFDSVLKHTSPSLA